MTTYNRPTALLGETAEAARIIMPGSDAERYFTSGLADIKMQFVANIFEWLSNPDAPRLGKVSAVGGGIAIAGEEDPNTANRLLANYVVSVLDNTISVTRVEFYSTGPEMRALGHVVLGMADPRDTEYFATDKTTPLSLAQVEEMQQLLCVVADDAEWATD